VRPACELHVTEGISPSKPWLLALPVVGFAGIGSSLGLKMGAESAEKDNVPLRIGRKASGGTMTYVKIPSGEKR